MPNSFSDYALEFKDLLEYKNDCSSELNLINWRLRELSHFLLYTYSKLADTNKYKNADGLIKVARGIQKSIEGGHKFADGLILPCEDRPNSHNYTHKSRYEFYYEGNHAK